jgi:hypothetical protein
LPNRAALIISFQTKSYALPGTLVSHQVGPSAASRRQAG